MMQHAEKLHVLKPVVYGEGIFDIINGKQRGEGMSIERR